MLEKKGKIDSIPTATQVAVDRKYRGVAPLEFVIVPDDLDEFRDVCFSDSKVICTKEVLHSYLTSKRVSKYWWYLTKEQRITLGKFIITNFCTFSSLLTGEGEPNCGGNAGNWHGAVCFHHANIRTCRMNMLDPYLPSFGRCYYKGFLKDPSGRIHSYIHCYIDITREEEYHLPCYETQVDLGTVGHSICALQVGEDASDFDSWLFFQYTNNDIKPGDSQMPYKTRVSIQYVDKDHCYCDSFWSKYHIADWYIDETGRPTKLSRGASSAGEGISGIEQMQEYLAEIVKKEENQIAAYIIDVDKILLFVHDFTPYQAQIPASIGGRKVLIKKILG